MLILKDSLRIFQVANEEVFDFWYQVRIGYKERVKELKEQGLDEEQLKNKMDLIKVSITETKPKPFEIFPYHLCESDI